ncbi:MAG: outer membrane beta-barrel protein [Gemmatimonadota bacterium]
MRLRGIAKLALLLVCSTAGSLQAQGTFGARIGTSVATLDTDAESILDEGNRSGPVFGVFYNRGPGTFGYQIEVLYAKRGTELAGGGALDLSYVQLPALLKVGVPVGLFRPGVFGGIALAVNVDCEVAENGGAGCDDISGFEVDDVDWNAVAGVDLELSLAAASLWADARYYVGLSDVGEFQDVLDDVTNRSWELTAGVGIPLP